MAQTVLGEILLFLLILLFLVVSFLTTVHHLLFQARQTVRQAFADASHVAQLVVRPWANDKPKEEACVRNKQGGLMLVAMLPSMLPRQHPRHRHSVEEAMPSCW